MCLLGTNIALREECCLYPSRSAGLDPVEDLFELKVRMFLDGLVIPIINTDLKEKAARTS